MMGFFHVTALFFFIVLIFLVGGDVPSHPLKDGIAAVNDVPFHIKSD